ncbi:soluble lamin-associated protein of 75 kDa isoform X2 [Hoplias malabaricus]|uniref:soluble lamin-associated protein of 75 kDa isoform X2 n=1 Tax=Hoplias malabaricus TaxID=27720 RepID=UPI0034632D5F
MTFPVDVLVSVSLEDLERSGQSCMSNLLYSDPAHGQFFTLTNGRKILIALSNVGFVPLYGANLKHKILALFAPDDQFTALALYLGNQWYSVDDILKTADPEREGLIEVRSVGERIVLYVLNRIVYRTCEMDTGEMPFLCHGENDFAKILWKSGEAVSFYSVKLKGSRCNNSESQRYLLPVMNSIFVRKSCRGNGCGLQMLEDFVSSFKEDELGLKYPLSPAMSQVCRHYLSRYPADVDLLWEVEGVGGPYQKTRVASKLHTLSLRVDDSNNGEMEKDKMEMTEETRLDFMEEITIVNKCLNVAEEMEDTPISTRTRSSEHKRKKRVREEKELVVESQPEKISRLEETGAVTVAVEMEQEEDRENMGQFADGAGKEPEIPESATVDHEPEEQDGIDAMSVSEEAAEGEWKEAEEKLEEEMAPSVAEQQDVSPVEEDQEEEASPEEEGVAGDKVEVEAPPSSEEEQQEDVVVKELEKGKVPPEAEEEKLEKISEEKEADPSKEELEANYEPEMKLQVATEAEETQRVFKAEENQEDPPEAEKNQEEPPEAEENQEEPPEAEENQEEPPEAEENQEEPPEAEENQEEPPEAEENQEEPPEAEENQEEPPEAEENQEKPPEAEENQEKPPEAEENQEKPPEAEEDPEEPPEAEEDPEEPTEAEEDLKEPTEAEENQEVPLEAERKLEVASEDVDNQEVPSEVEGKLEVLPETEEKQQQTLVNKMCKPVECFETPYAPSEGEKHQEKAMEVEESPLEPERVTEEENQLDAEKHNDNNMDRLELDEEEAEEEKEKDLQKKEPEGDEENAVDGYEENDGKSSDESPAPDVHVLRGGRTKAVPPTPKLSSTQLSKEGAEEQEKEEVMEEEEKMTVEKQMACMEGEMVTTEEEKMTTEEEKAGHSSEEEPPVIYRRVLRRKTTAAKPTAHPTAKRRSRT